MKRYVIIITLLLLPNIILCDNDQWKLVKLFSNFKSIHLDRIYGIDIDSEGNIWIGTCGDECSAILTKFDGTTSTSYTTENYPNVNNYIMCMDIDSDDNIWFGTYKHGLYKFDGNNFINYNSSNSPLDSNKIVGISILNNSPIIATEEALYHYINNKWIVIDSIFNEFTGTDIGSVYIDSSGNIIAFVHGYYYQALLKYDGATWTSYLSSEYEVIDNIQSMLIDYDNSLWIGTEKHGIAHIKSSNEWEYFYKEQIGSNDDTFRFLILNPNDSSIWLQGDDAIYNYNRKNWKKILFDDIPFTGKYTPYPLLVDKNNNLWINTKEAFVLYNEHGVKGIEYETLSVNEDNINSIEIHPNPATSQITLTLSDEYISEPQIDIIDNLGFTHDPEYHTNSKEITINTSSLSPGVYFLRIRSGGQVETKKFVVVR